jgi:WD repeat-containing protein 48
MGVALAKDDTKVNFGVQIVHALLRDWARKRRAELRNPDGDVGEEVELKDSRFDINALDACDDARVFRAPERAPTFYFEPPEPPYDPTDASSVQKKLALVLLDGARVAGTSLEEALLPEWIVDVAAERYRVPETPKTSFYVSEEVSDGEDETGVAKDGASRRPLTSGKVTAPRVLGIKKVCAYVVSKLGLELDDDVRAEDVIEVFCDGKKLDPKWSLATVREHVWKRGEDVRLTFRVSAPAARDATAATAATGT